MRITSRSWLMTMVSTCLPVKTFFTLSNGKLPMPSRATHSFPTTVDMEEQLAVLTPTPMRWTLKMKHLFLWIMKKLVRLWMTTCMLYLLRVFVKVSVWRSLWTVAIEEVCSTSLHRNQMFRARDVVQRIAYFDTAKLTLCFLFCWMLSVHNRW